VLLVNNLDPEKANVDAIFTLFGVYGDVTKVKILYNNKSTALVQFSTPAQASAAKSFLHQVEWNGKKLFVIFSKNPNISLPPANPKFPSVGLTKDFSGSPLHRYRRPGSRNEKHICAPSPSLHVSNLPEDPNVEEIKSFFSQHDEKVEAVKIFGVKTNMAIVTYGSVGEAIQALINYHFAKYGDKNIKVTFSHAKA